MSVRPTLHSKLRVLVAKAFRAEKLYSSIRNNRGLRNLGGNLGAGDIGRGSNSDGLASAASDYAGDGRGGEFEGDFGRDPSFVCPSALASAANDMRAREWQRGYYELRLALNELLNDNKKSHVIQELQALYARYQQRIEQSAAAINEGSEFLIQASRRQEFAHVFRLSSELIRQKATAQVSRVICEELASVLEYSRSRQAAERLPAERGASAGLPERGVPEGVVPERAAGDEPGPTVPTGSNVVPLRRRFAAGARR